MIIQLMDGRNLNIEDYGIKRLFHRIPSQSIEHITSNISGYGDFITSTNIGNRIIEVEFGFRVKDVYEFYLLRDELNQLFVRSEEFYIIFKREPHKRYKVRLNDQFLIEPTSRLQSFTVGFVTTNKYAESVATTNDLKEWDVDKWAWNGTIEWDNDLIFSFNDSSFNLNNLGTAPIDPRENELEIVLKGAFSSYVEIINNTTGDVYRYNRGLSSSDELRISGIRTFRNGISDFKNTNKQIITLAPSNNFITVQGGVISNISFDFRFLYK